MSNLDIIAEEPILSRHRWSLPSWSRPPCMPGYYPAFWR